MFAYLNNVQPEVVIVWLRIKRGVISIVKIEAVVS